MQDIMEWDVLCTGTLCFAEQRGTQSTKYMYKAHSLHSPTSHVISTTSAGAKIAVFKSVMFTSFVVHKFVVHKFVVHKFVKAHFMLSAYQYDAWHSLQNATAAAATSRPLAMAIS